MVARDENTDSSRDGSGQKQLKDVGQMIAPRPATLWQEKKDDKAQGRIGSGTRGAADTRAAGDG